MIAGSLDYCRTRLNSLGLVEWTDSFNFENIPRTLLDDVYHLELGVVARKLEDHDNIELNVPLTVRVFGRAFVDTGAGRDAAIEQGDTIIDDFVCAANRLTDSVIKTIQFDSMELLPLTDTNDNSLILVLDFTALVVKSTR
jgi:hypothetical protein